MQVAARSATSREPREQRVGELRAAGVLERERVGESRAELGLELLTHELLGPMKTALHRRRITNTTRKGAGKLSIARSSNSRTWPLAAVFSGSKSR